MELIKQTPVQEQVLKKKSKFPIGKIIAYIILLFYVAFLFAPFYTILISAFVEHTELVSSVEFIWWPKTFSLQGFANLFEYDTLYLEIGISSIVLGFFNTLWMSILPLVVGLGISGLAAYVYSKMTFPGKEFLFTITLITMMIPLGSFTVVTFTFYNSVLNWSGTPLPLIVPAMFGGGGWIFFLRAYFEGISTEIVEAAKIDGKSHIGIYFSIMMPLAIPAFVAQFIFGFVGRYNDYIGPLLYLSGEKMMVTLQFAVHNVQSAFKDYPETICASAVASMIPVIILYCFCQKLFINGIAVGGGKE